MNDDEFEKYLNTLKPIEGENTYVDFDVHTQCWGIFGAESKFCYRLYSSEEEANSSL